MNEKQWEVELEGGSKWYETDQKEFWNTPRKFSEGIEMS